MRTVGEWKALLRAELRKALAARRQAALAVLRETLAAIDNAEAPPARGAPASQAGVIAGTAGGLGAGEVARLALSPDEVVAIVERELAERRQAAEEYVRLGRGQEASVLSEQGEVLEALLRSPL